MKSSFYEVSNATAFPLAEVPVLSFDDWKEAICSKVRNGAHLSALTLLPNHQLCAVLSDPANPRLLIASTTVGESYPALTPDCPQAHLFEREIFEQHAIEPLGHPWLKPVRKPLEMAAKDAFYKVEGEEIHEVAVGPVHAGVIEPGHFRFQCHGEMVHHLEIALGYQHRGIEARLVGKPNLRTPHYIETLAGDTTIGHATAYAQLMEPSAPPRAEAIRAIAAELERLANHVGDLGALSGDVGFLPTMSYCGRLRGDLLNLTALICGNRFGRGLVRPGGVQFDLSPKIIQTLETRLETIESDVYSSLKLLFNAPSVLARFEETGKVSTKTAREIGLVGPAARASGCDGDVRIHHPSGAYRQMNLEPVVEKEGDCLARAHVRQREIKESFQIVRSLLKNCPEGTIQNTDPIKLEPNRLIVSLVEGWRGEICHLAVTGSEGEFLHYKVVDPSFHNWLGLALALRGEAISDFPLCNKSFNLSYCGHDL